MEQRPAAHGGHHEPSRAPSVSARARLAAAVRDDGAGPLPGTRAEDTPPRLPPEDGLEPVRRLGARSWLVREARSGEHFVLRPCPEEPGPERDRSRAALRSLAVALAGRDAACLVAVRGLLGPAAAPVGLVEDFLRGGSLADRLAERGRLAPAEAAAVLRDAATGLAALHALGRCHGELSARKVLFRGTVTPRESPAACPAERTAAADGAGHVAAVRAGTAAGSPEEDVRALGALGWAALTGRAPAREARRAPLSLLCPGAPPGLVRAVEAALDLDASARPTAAELADRFARAQEPDPGGRRVAAARPEPVRTGGGRRAALVGAAALLLAAGGAVLLPLSGAGPSPDPAADPANTPATTPPARPSSAARPGPVAPGSLVDPPQNAVEDADPRRALRELVARRGEALRIGDARLLDEVYAPGARAAAADRDTIARADGGFPGLVLEAESVRDGPAGSAPPGGVVLVAEVRVDGHRGGPGTVPSVVPAGDGWVQTILVELVHGEQGWLLSGVEPAAGATAPPGTGSDGPSRNGQEPDGQEPARQDPRG
ncbi:hypothetical protein [Kocuria rosea]|uniref:Protein kinase domain-containing protein n=1 Tax=Kocuria rosea TaxID=1275 RepID=A0A4R5Y2R6_KOCRO|nr:hypothetical protein [Kocuria rosea]TDL37807.1 hypothetical protein E2R59_17795 [Kocuria rosea]